MTAKELQGKIDDLLMEWVIRWGLGAGDPTTVKDMRERRGITIKEVFGHNRYYDWTGDGKITLEPKALTRIKELQDGINN